MRIAFVAGGSVQDRRAWSGTVHYAHRALAKRFEVVPIETPRATRLFNRLRHVVRRTGFDILREQVFSEALVRPTARLIRQADVDAVFVLGASHLAAGLVDRFPVFHCSDTTFANMVDYHKNFVGLSRRSVQAGNAMEGKVIRGSRAVFLSSDWAARSARSVYGRASGVEVVPFGANLDELPVADTWRRTEHCTLVFVGVAWFEKGADTAVETARLLNERGISVVLHMVGCMPPPDVAIPPYVKLHGFLRKQVPPEYAALTALVANADFLIVPTRFEAYGIVFCEAAAYGTPAVARRTGGVPAIIDDGVTGLLLPPADEPEAYAARIAEVWAEPDRYQAMRRAAFSKSRRVLNWDAWGDRVAAVMLRGLEAQTSPPDERGDAIGAVASQPAATSSSGRGV